MKRSKAKKQNLVKTFAIVAAGGLVTFGLWKFLIKPKFFPENKESNTNEDESDQKQLPSGEKPSQTNVKPKTSGFDIDKKIKPGDKGDLVYRVQKAINAIAALRGDNTYFDKDTKKTINFPLPTDPKLSEFAARTKSGAKYAFPSFRSKGYTTVRKAREQWARVAGYYDKPFPQDLVNASNYDDLRKIYDLSRAKKVIQDIF